MLLNNAKLNLPAIFIDCVMNGPCKLAEQLTLAPFNCNVTVWAVAVDTTVVPFNSTTLTVKLSTTCDSILLYKTRVVPLSPLHTADPVPLAIQVNTTVSPRHTGEYNGDVWLRLVNDTTIKWSFKIEN